MMPKTHHRHTPPWYRAHAPRSPPYSDMGYAMRGVTDMSRMAMAGVVDIGTLGMLGSIIKK